jgi:hypothetical protein
MWRASRASAMNPGRVSYMMGGCLMARLRESGERFSKLNACRKMIGLGPIEDTLHRVVTGEDGDDDKSGRRRDE